MSFEKTEFNRYIPRLFDYLSAKGVRFDTNKNPLVFQCINPAHADNNPSTALYDNSGNQSFNCFSCGVKGDVFDAAGLITGAQSFKERLEEIQKTLGDLTSQEPPKIPVEKRAEPAKIKPLPREEAREIFSQKKVCDMAEFTLKVPVEDRLYFPYFNEDGLIDIMVIRFEEKESGKKHVLTFYYDGKNVKMKNYPVLIYGRDLLAKSEKPVLIHEGEKCANIANEQLPDFVSITWNGGGKKFNQVDWSPLIGREVYILPDDDKPGQETGQNLKKLLSEKYGIEAKITPVFEKARTIKKRGADVEEILQVYESQEIQQIILQSENRPEDKKNFESDIQKHDSKETEKIHAAAVNANNNSAYPFSILGIADDGRAYFLDYTRRLISHSLSSLSDKKLIELAGLNFFKMEYGGRMPKTDDWLVEIDQIMQISKNIDFDLKNIRGRGAWKTQDGEICYYDGKQVIGPTDSDWTFLRKPKRNIGINQDPADYKLRQEVVKITRSFSFQNSYDVARLLAWSVLAPFGGALKWRPCILITGGSGSGKSTIVQGVVRKLTQGLYLNGVESTEPGVRESLAGDSYPVIIDEAEPTKNRHDIERIERIFGMMRGSTTDDAPVTAKGTGGKGVNLYTIQSMFCFSSINAAIDNVADDNRITRINFVKMDNFEQFVKNYKSLNNILTKENCEAIRAFTWQNLEMIVELAGRLEFIIQTVTGQSARFASGEAVLLAAYFIVWDGLEGEVSDKELKDLVFEFYKNQLDNLHREKRDETSEMIDRVLDEPVIVQATKETRSIRSLLLDIKFHMIESEKPVFEQREEERQKFNIINENYKDIKQIVELYGVTVHRKSKELAIINSHHAIQRILKIGSTYHRQLERHKNTIEKSVNIYVSGTTKRCTVIAGFLDNYKGEE